MRHRAQDPISQVPKALAQLQHFLEIRNTRLLKKTKIYMIKTHILLIIKY